MKVMYASVDQIQLKLSEPLPTMNYKSVNFQVFHEKTKIKKTY